MKDIATLDLNSLRENCDYNPWGLVCIEYALPESFMRDHQDKVMWQYTSRHQVMSEAFIDEFSHKVHWLEIFKSQVLSVAFIRKHVDRLLSWYYWDQLVKNQALDEAFLTEYLGDFDHRIWKEVSKYQKLSETFILAHADVLDWAAIARYQDLSESFILANKDRLDMKLIGQYQNISQELADLYNIKKTIHAIVHHVPTVDRCIIRKLDKPTECQMTSFGVHGSKSMVSDYISKSFAQTGLAALRGEIIQNKLFELYAK